MDFLDLITSILSALERGECLPRQKGRVEEQGADATNSLANHVSRLLINKTGCSVASETLVHLTLVSFKPGGAHALHVSAAGERAGPGVHAVVMTDVCSAFGEIKRERSAYNEKRRKCSLSRFDWSCMRL